MDNLTHGLTGAVMAQAGLKKKTGLGLIALILGANLPDIDVVSMLWLDEQETLGFRRGITHGPIGVTLLPLGLAMGHWWLAALAAVVIAVSVRLQAPLLRVFARSGGFVFAVAGWAFHQLHLIYSAASFVWCLVFRRRRAA